MTMLACQLCGCCREEPWRCCLLLSVSPPPHIVVSALCAVCCRGVIVPPLPEKNAVQKFQMNTEFIEDRRRALQVWTGLHNHNNSFVTHALLCLNIKMLATCLFNCQAVSPSVDRRPPQRPCPPVCRPYHSCCQVHQAATTPTALCCQPVCMRCFPASCGGAPS